MRINAGTYTGEEGVVDDIQPECSTVRVRTDSGHAYAFTDAVSARPTPRMPSKGKTIIKR